MSDLLSIGMSGVRAYKSALTAVGENVANAETPGYSRRTVVLKQAPTPGIVPDPVYVDTIQFAGVNAEGVQRAWDTFRATEARFAASADGSASVREQWLTSIETALGNGSAAVGVSLTRFFNAGDALAPKPDDHLGRATMVTALEDIGSAFRTSAAALGRVADGIRTAAGLDVDGLNGALAALHQINGTIQTSQAGGAARASLEDERDRLIDTIAQRVDIETSIAANGTARLTIGGASGQPLLNGLGPGYVGIVTAADGRISLQITKEGTTTPLPASAGRLAGLVQVASMTADRRATLDALAQDVATDFNAWSAAGLDQSGNPGAPLIDASGGAGSVSILISDPTGIAAAAPSGTTNGNLFALVAMRGTGGPEARWNRLVSDSGQALATVKSEAAAASAWRDNAFAVLDEVTGVDLDREAAELLRYQQAYSGATRVIQVARETINSILELF
ncbi:MAG: flagellar hook-associated protein FlgK [Allosphingosinicella sp.]